MNYMWADTLQLAERGHLLRPHPEHALVHRVGRRGQLAAQVEQLVLQPAQHLVEPAVPAAALLPLRIEHASQPDHRVQLVDGAVRLDARRVLGHATAAYQRGLATPATRALLGAA